LTSPINTRSLDLVFWELSVCFFLKYLGWAKWLYMFEQRDPAFAI
jgi:hypothetical protein